MYTPVAQRKEGATEKTGYTPVEDRTTPPVLKPFNINTSPQEASGFDVFRTPIRNTVAMSTPSFVPKVDKVKPEQRIFNGETPPQPPSSLKEIQSRGEELRAGKKNLFERFIDSDIPPIVRTIVTQLKEGFVGKGQEPDITGTTKIDTGLVGLFRPFGLGKTDFERVTERYDKLIEAGVSDKRATDIATKYVKAKVNDPLIDMNSEQERKKALDKLNLTKEEKGAIRSVAFFETLDKVFGALDLVGVGSISKVGLKALVKTKTAEEASILLKRIGVSDEGIEMFAKEVADIKSEKQAKEFYQKLSDFQNSTKELSTYIPVETRISPYKAEIQNLAENFIKKEPPYGLLQDLKAFAKYNDFGELPNSEKDANMFKKDIRTALENFGVDSFNMSDRKIADFADAVIQKGEEIPKNIMPLPKIGGDKLKKIPSELPFEKTVSVEEVQKEFATLFDENEIDFLLPVDNIKDNVNSLGRFSTTRAMRNPLIEVVQSGGKVSNKTLYHEAMHAYLYKFTSPEEKKALLKAVKESKITKPAREYLKKYYEGEDVIAEEYIADYFADWLYTQRAPKKLIPFFQRILEKIKSWIRKLSGIDAKLQPLFKKIVTKDRSYVRPQGRVLDVTRFKQISPVDRLIAEGKIKINRVGNRDVYSYKKGNKWQVARDEDSAVKAIMKKEGSPLLQQKKIELEIKKDIIDNHPAQGLGKYVSRRGEFKGELQEVTGEGGTFGKRGDDIATEKGFEDSEQAREAYKDLQQKKAEIEQLKQEIRDLRVSGEQELTQPSRVPREEAQSLEDTAQQVLNKVDEPYRGKIPSLETIITDKSTPVKEKVGILDYFRTPDRVLQKIGLGDVAKELRKGYDNYVKELPLHLDTITEWSKSVPKESNVNIFRYLDGQDIKLNDTEMKVANEVKQYLSEWADRLGLPEDNRISHYITHIFNIDEVPKEFDEEIAKIIKEKVPGSVYDPFLEKRLGKKGYIEDTWQALDAYVKRAVRKSNMDPALEQMKRASKRLEDSQFEYVKRLGDRINLRPTEWDNLIDNNIKQIVGYRFGQRPVNIISGTLRKMVYRGALGLNLSSALKNLTQGVNTFAKLGTRDTLNGYINLMKPGMAKELEESGILKNSFIQDRTLSATRQTIQKMDKGLFAMFELAEIINRGSAYFGAKAKAIREGMSEEQAMEYAKKLVRDTQFTFGSIDTPVAMQGDIAKTLLQFGNFSQKQIEFLTEMAKNKEWAGIIRYIIAATAIVYTVGEVLGIDSKDFNPLNYFSRFGKPPSLALPISIFKAVTNMPDQYGNEKSLESKIKDITYSGKTLIPGGVQIGKLLKGGIITTPKKEKKKTNLPKLPKINNKLPTLPKLPRLN